ncbi:hypothetical protein AJ87_45555 [Rhizobium yanglingense]|nr:hypothetical protein AJ87_45555 [Rhizobium yanglingense]
MQNVGNVFHCGGRDMRVGDRALCDFDTAGLRKQTIMAKRADACFRKSRIVKQPSNEAPPDLARRTGNKDQLLSLPQTANIRLLRTSTGICHTKQIFVMSA